MANINDNSSSGNSQDAPAAPHITSSVGKIHSKKFSGRREFERAPITWKPQNRFGLKHCPVCGYKQPDNCSAALDEDGEPTLIYCRRPSLNQTGLVGKPGRDGGATFNLNPRQSVTAFRPSPRPRPAPREPEFYRADADHVDAIYCTLLAGHLSLREGHRAKLGLRGLDDVEIDRLGLKSAPTRSECDVIADALSKYDLRGVPGFYRDGREWRLRDLGSGVYLPVRDLNRRIRGLQLRRDEGEPRYIWLSSPPDKFPDGASSGAPVHFARPQRIRTTGTALLTEGCLKGNIISAFLDCGVIAVAGVSTFSDGFGSLLREQLPELKRVVLAYDSDWKQKKEVRKALLRLQRVLTAAGIRWSVRTWDASYKGYDDYLNATANRKEVAA